MGEAAGAFIAFAAGNDRMYGHASTNELTSASVSVGRPASRRSLSAFTELADPS